MSEVFLCKMAKSMMAKFKMAAIIKLSENEWVKFFCAKWLNPWWQISRWLPSWSWVRMHEWSFFLWKSWIQDGRFQDGCHYQVESEWTSEFFVQIGWIQDSRIQDGCHHQFEWECMREVFFVEMAESKMAKFNMTAIIKLSENELVWVRVRMEWECFWVNLREDNKVSKSKMAVSESNMAKFKMTAIIKLSQNEWVKFFFLCKMAESKTAEFKMTAIIKLSENEWVWFRLN